ncbi:GNAT family N-acetyltransferase [Nocardiopsis baichengensis]|uniref:GNAT family N-acetyltransferase n=1 Tax=Nocardiopsis baichengensis TaxID=280240 RepID=UPI00034DB20E|nr:GNAT family N-acetyltransferase [Nocardiopsis baichengensis]WNB50064.1 GNAT family N-acetyltransferase [Nocardiopsis baichengensis]
MPDSTRAPWRSPREIPAGPDVLAAGPPPVPASAPPFAMRVARAGGADLETLHTWMNRPHVERFFERAWTRERWAEEIAGQVSGTFSRPVLVSEDGRDAAYIELYRAARDVVGEAYRSEPHDVGLHIAIGEEQDTGRRLGARIFAAVTQAVFAADRRCRTVLIEPDAANAPARRAAERAGLRFGGEVALPHKKAALFFADRPEGDHDRE